MTTKQKKNLKESRIVFGLFIVAAGVMAALLFLIGGVMLICREISRVCLVLEYAYGKKKGESSKEGES